MGLFILFAVAALLLLVTVTLVILHRMAHPPRKTYAVALARNLPTSPADMSLTYVEKRMALPNGSYSTGWTIDGQGPADLAVLIIHGFGDSRYGAQLWAPMFTPHAGKVAVYDLRGHGDSSDRKAPRGLDDVHDVPLILQQLDLPARVVLFGYSLGSGIALAAAAELSERQPDRIAGVILDGAYRFGREPLAAVLRKKKIPTQPFVWLIDAWYTLASGPPGKFDRVLFSAKLRCPLLVLHGCDDEMCPIDSVRQIAQAAPEGELVVIDGARHLEAVQHNPDAYGAALARFFAKVAAAGARGEDAAAEKEAAGDSSQPRQADSQKQA